MDWWPPEFRLLVLIIVLALLVGAILVCVILCWLFRLIGRTVMETRSLR